MRTTAPTETPSSHDERAQIAELYAAFSIAANRHEWRAMADLMADDALWQAEAGALGFRRQGRQAIYEWLVGNVPRLEVKFYLSSAPWIESISGDRARSWVTISEILHLKAEDRHIQISGIYEDELVRRDGRWLFALRTVTVRTQVAVVPEPAL